MLQGPCASCAVEHRWSKEDWVNVLVKNPILIERTIVTDGKNALDYSPIFEDI